MSLLIEKNDPADPARILAALYAREAIYDIPLVILRPEEFYGSGAEEARVTLDDRLGSSLSLLCPEKDRQYPVICRMADIILDIANDPQNCECYAILRLRNPMSACHYKPEYYSEHKVGVVLGPKADMQGADFISHILSIPKDYLGLIPGDKAHWQCYALLHEFAHVAGAGEPQAEALAGLQFKKIFKQDDVLMALADMRAVKAIHYCERSREVLHYGWPMVEVLDNIIRAPQEKIDALSAQQIKDFRFKSFDYKAEFVRAVGHALVSRPEGYEFEDLLHGAFFGQAHEDTYRIAARYYKAVTRLGLQP